MVFIGYSSLLVNIFLGLVYAVDKTVNPSLDISLENAPTQLDRLALLPQDSDWLFDFRAQAGYTFAPGSVVNANAATFPATVGSGMTIAMLNLGPCAMLAPHFHPRATNMVVAIEGTTNTYMVQENGDSMQNTGCGNATLVSALNSQDTGTSNMANILFSQFPADIVTAAFGNIFGNVSAIAQGIPPVGTGSVLGSAKCLEACKSGKVYTGP